MEMFIIKDMFNQLKKDYINHLNKDMDILGRGGNEVIKRSKDIFSGYSCNEKDYSLFYKIEDNGILSNLNTAIYIKDKRDLLWLIERLNECESVYIYAKYVSFNNTYFIDCISDLELEKSFSKFIPELSAVVENRKYKKDFIKNNIFNLSYLFNNRTIEQSIVLLEQHRLDLQLKNF